MSSVSPMAAAAVPVSTPEDAGPPAGSGGAAAAARPLPLRPRGGFGGYLNQLRRERGLTVRQLASAAGVHHTYVSKLERGDRQAPDEAVVETLAAALSATPAQLDQLRWRAGLAPRGAGAPGQDDPTLTLVAEALGDATLSAAARDQLRQRIAQLARPAETPPASIPGSGLPPFAAAAGVLGSAAPPYAAAAAAPGLPPALSAPRLAPEAPLDGRAALLAGLIGGWQTLDEAAAELRVTAAYLWELVQTGHLRAWALPGAAPGSPAGVRLRREDVLGLLQPVQPLR